jgi:hypothetical protein
MNTWSVLLKFSGQDEVWEIFEADSWIVKRDYLVFLDKDDKTIRVYNSRGVRKIVPFDVQKCKGRARR